VRFVELAIELWCSDDARSSGSRGVFDKRAVWGTAASFGLLETEGRHALDSEEKSSEDTFSIFALIFGNG
jgi:hypothetical protein